MFSNGDKKYNEFLLACTSKDVEKVKSILKTQNFDIKRKYKNDENSLSALHILCCTLDNPEVVKLLIQSGANIEQIAVSEVVVMTPLIAACINKHINNVKALLECEANVNPTGCSTTPLHESVRGPIEITQLLITAGADLNIPVKNNETGRFLTPLDYCIIENRFDVFELLVKRGAVVNAALCLALACGYGNIEIITFLENIPNLVTSDAYKGCLHEACKFERVEVVRLLIERGVDVKSLDEAGLTALYYACDKNSKKSTEIIKLIVAANFCLKNDENGYLHHCCSCGNLEAVNVLIKAGAKLNESFEGEIPLTCACIGGHLDIVARLLEEEAEVNRQFELTCTALHFACHGGHIEIVKLLIGAEANVNLLGRHKKYERVSSPLHAACSRNHIEIVKILIDKGSNLDYVDENGRTAIFFACSLSHWDIVKLLIKAGADLNIANETGSTSLIVACVNNQDDIVEMLLDYGANVNVAEKAGRTPLMIATHNNLSMSIMQKMIILGADVNAKDKHGHSALHYAVERNNIDKTMFLLRRGANINIQNQNGETPLHMAPNMNMYDLLEAFKADMNILDNKGRRATGHPTLSSMFRDKNQYANTVSMIDEQTVAEQQSVKTKVALKGIALLSEARWSRSRLLVVGEGGAGKTSFVRNLMDMRYNPDHVSTPVVAVKEIQSGNHSKVTLQSADLGMNTEEVTTSNWSKKQRSNIDSVMKQEYARRVLLSKSEQVELPQVKAPVTVAKLSPEIASDSVITQVDDNTSAKIPTAHSSTINPSLSEGTNKPTNMPSPIVKHTSAPPKQYNAATFKKLGELTLNLDKVTAEDCTDSDVLSITFSIWDFGGQTMFQTVQHLFLTRYGVYSVVFDMSKVARDGRGDILNIPGLSHWLSLIARYAKGAPICVIGSHADTVSEGDLHTKISSFVVSSAQSFDVQSNLLVNFGSYFWPIDNTISDADDNQTILRLRSVLEYSAKTDESGYIHMKIPVTWLAVCDKLKALSVEYPYLPVLEFTAEISITVYNIAVECGVLNNVKKDLHESVIASMLLKFNELGTVLYFDSNVELRKYVILDPQWLADKIVHLVRDFQLHRLESDSIAIHKHTADWIALISKGVVSATLLSYMWSKDRDRMAYILNVLLQLGLVCKLPSVGNVVRYFVPAALLYTQGESSVSLSEFNQYAECSVMLSFAEEMIPSGFVDRLFVLFTKEYFGLYEKMSREGNSFDPKLVSEHGIYTIQLLFPTSRIVELVTETTSVYISVLFSTGQLLCYCDRSVIDFFSTVLRTLSDTIIVSYLNCSVEYEITVTSEYIDNVHNFNAHSIDRGMFELAELTGYETLNNVANHSKSVDIFHHWLSEECKLPVDDARIYAAMLVDDGFNAGLISIIDGLTSRCDEGEEHFLKYLSSVGIRNSKHRKLIYDVAKLTDVQKTTGGYCCLALTEDLNSDTCMELAAICTGMKNFFVRRRVFSVNTVFEELRDRYDVLHMCSATFNLVGKVRSDCESVFVSSEQRVSFVNDVLTSSRNGGLSCVCLSVSHSSVLASELCEKGLKCAIGWKSTVNNVAAKVFVEEFYRTLNSNCGMYELAFERAVKALTLRNFAICDPKDSDLLERMKEELQNPSLVAAGIPVFVTAQQFIPTPSLLVPDVSAAQVEYPINNHLMAYMDAKFDRVSSKLQEIKSSTVSIKRMVTSIARGGIDYPSLFLILKQKSSRLSLVKNMMIVFLCPVDGKICPYDGQPGYSFTTPKGWVLRGFKTFSKFKEDYGWLLTLSAFALSTATTMLSGLSLSDLIPEECMTELATQSSVADFVQQYVTKYSLTADKLGVTTSQLLQQNSTALNNPAVQALVGQEYNRFVEFLATTDFKRGKLKMRRIVHSNDEVEWVSNRYSV